MLKKGLIILCIFYFSCENEEKTFTISKTDAEIRINKILLDTILISHPNTSFQGFMKFDSSKKEIIYFDELFSTVSRFTLDGKFIESLLGKGDSPKEVQGINNYLKLGNEHLIFKGYSVYHFNENWERTKKTTLNFESEKSFKELENNPKPEDIGIYEVKYFNNDFLMYDMNHIMFNIETTHPKYNGYLSTTSKNYFESAKILGVAELNSGKVTSLQGKCSTIYRNLNNIPNFANWHFDKNNDDIYLNFEADSLIYVYDKSFNPVKGFGRSGKVNNTKYRKTNSYDDAMNLNYSDRQRYGYYYTLKCFPQKSLIFRCYKLGTNQDVENINKDNPDDENPMRMQIYLNEILVGDVPVPNHFKIIGTDGKYFYADGFMNEENGVLGFYRFSL